MRLALVFSVLLGVLLGSSFADPTWPSSIDEMEDLMYLLTGYLSRGFNAPVTPCGYSALSVGRNAAAEWLRTAFHDMATANVYFGYGGIDASLMFETDRAENIGASFNSTLASMAPFYNSRASVSDLIALGVYISVRGCGGPVVAVRAGRVDATAAGPIGVPEPQDSLFTFENQFSAMGFNSTQMIQMTACGHTIGGVHSEDFPTIVIAGSVPNNYQFLDTTEAKFDNKLVTEFIAGNTTNPLVVGPAISAGRASDVRVYEADQNVTMKTMTDSTVFSSTCSLILQQMIEVVPPGVTLTDTMSPYEVKPTALQLTLQPGGATIVFSGNIRVRTTVRSQSSIASVQLLYTDRTGASAGTAIESTVAGAANGFDETFTFYSFSANLSSSTSISSFTVQITLSSGTIETYDNNGSGYPIQDSVIFQSPQSCLVGTQLTVTAAVRSGASSTPNVRIYNKVARRGAIVPLLTNSSVALTKSSTVGPYDIYSVNTNIDLSQQTSAKFDVYVGLETDGFKDTANLGSTCSSLGGSASSSSSLYSTSTTSSGAPASSSVSQSISPSSSSANSSSANPSSASSSSSSPSSASPSSASSSSASSSSASSSSASSSSASSSSASISSSDTAVPTLSTGSSSSTYTVASSSESPSASSTFPISSISSTSSESSTPSQTAPSLKETIGEYNYYGCQTEATGSRALSSSSYANSSMTLESCAAFCSGYIYWGTEYSDECYCGNDFASGSTSAPESDCSFTCAGNDLEYCGAGNRLSVYVINNTADANPTPSIKQTVGNYSFYACRTEATNSRALNSASLVVANMTLEVCSDFCNGYTYWGTEYADECYCGDEFQSGSVNASSTDCDFLCAGNSLEYCGAGNRLSVYVL